MKKKSLIPERVYLQEGKIPPQATDLEELVLGAILVDQDAIKIAINILQEDSFYHPKHRIIYHAILQLHRERMPIDIGTVAKRIEDIGESENIGGNHKITELTWRVASAANVEFHCRIVEQNAIGRRVISECLRTADLIYSDPVKIFEHVNAMMTRMSQPDIAVTSNDSSADSRINAAVKHIQDAMDGKNVGITTGYRQLDECTGGWQNGDLIVIAARPGMGKSALSLNLAHNALPGAIFIQQMEMTKPQVGIRELAMYTKNSIHNLKKGQLLPDEMDQVRQVAADLKKVKVFSDFTAGCTSHDVAARIIKHKSDHNIRLAMVDYLQIIKYAEGSNTDEAIGEITSSFKRLAKDLDIPIILFSQLNRAVENRDNKRPQLSDLRSSGNIEQDADIVIFLMRPDYYDEFATDENGNSMRGKMIMNFAKNRQGFTGDYIMNHDLSRNLIFE